MSLQSINPSTNEVLKNYEEESLEQILKRLEGTEKAYQAWKQTSISHRADLLKKSRASSAKKKRRVRKINCFRNG